MLGFSVGVSAFDVLDNEEAFVREDTFMKGDLGVSAVSASRASHGDGKLDTIGNGAHGNGNQESPSPREREEEARGREGKDEKNGDGNGGDGKNEREILLSQIAAKRESIEAATSNLAAASADARALREGGKGGGKGGEEVEKDGEKDGGVEMAKVSLHPSEYSQLQYDKATRLFWVIVPDLVPRTSYRFRYILIIYYIY